MDIEDMTLLRKLIEQIAGMAEGGYILSNEEVNALYRLDIESNLNEAHRLHLLRLSLAVGMEPGELLYLKRLAGLGVTGIE